MIKLNEIEIVPEDYEPPEEKSFPASYFLTFVTYGMWLHGDKRFSVDPWHNKIGKQKIQPNSKLYDRRKQQMKYPSVTFNYLQRNIVMNAIKSVCSTNGWALDAVHVRTNHVHVIVSALLEPEKVMTKMKIDATKALKRNGAAGHQPKKYWVRHGSTGYIWEGRSLFPAMKYVIDGQGVRMACCYAKWYDKVRRFSGLGWDF